LAKKVPKPLSSKASSNFQQALNNTFRQRISRLVRESLSFSKKMENHVGEPFGILSMTTMHSKAKD